MSVKIDQVAFAAELLQEGYGVQLIARGYSMQPLIPDGAKLVLQPITASQIHRGDIVLTVYCVEDKGDGSPEIENKLFLIHRVILVKSSSDGAFALQTRGDSTLKLDQMLRIPPENLCGKVTAVDFNGQHYDYKTLRWRLVNLLIGWASFNQVSRIADFALTTSAPAKLQIVQRKFFSWLFYFLLRNANRFNEVLLHEE